MHAYTYLQFLQSQAHYNRQDNYIRDDESENRKYLCHCLSVNL